MTTTFPKYFITETIRNGKNGELERLVTKKGKPWVWLNSQQYHNLYHTGKVFPKITKEQKA